MKKLIEFIIKSIVNNPKKVVVEEIDNQETGYNRLILQVDPEDMGKIIGKQGRIIKAIRNLLHVKSIINRKRTFLVLKEEGKNFPSPSEQIVPNEETHDKN